MTKIPTIKEIKENILTAIKTELYSNKADSIMLERSVWNVFAIAMAGVLRSLYEFGRYQYRQIFTITADAQSLELKGEQYGIYRKKGRYTVMEAEFSGTEGAEIPENTQLIYKNYMYLTNNSVSIQVGGKVKTTITATIIGINTILQNDTEVDFVSPIANVIPTAVIKNTIVRGENEEDIEQYRLRIQNYEQQRPQGGAVPDFIEWTTQVPEIVDAMIVPVQRECTPVKVYPIADETIGSRIPSSEKIEEVQNYLDDPIRRPPCLIEVIEPEELEIDITVRNLTPNTDGSKQILQSVWRTYLNKKRPRQYTNQENKDNVINASTLISTALSNNINDLVITKMSIKGKPSLSIPYVLKLGELAKLGAITYE